MQVCNQQSLRGWLTHCAKVVVNRWDSNPAGKTSFAKFTKIIDMSRPVKKSILDCMMEALDDCMTRLKIKAEEKTVKLNAARLRMDNLSYSIKFCLHLLPPLCQRVKLQPESFDSVTIYFSDIAVMKTF